MATYKTFFILIVISVTSALGLTISRLSSSEDDSNPPEVRDFAFADDYFSEKSDGPTEEKSETFKNCEKVVKDGMVCLICEEPERNGKYEQCAYVSHPRKKSLSYQRSKSEPEIDEITSQVEDNKSQPKRRQETEDSDEYFINSPQKKDKKKQKDDDSDNDSNNNSNSNNDNDDSKNISADFASVSEKISKNIKDDDCEEVERDGMSCMQCKSGKTGGKYEKCSSAFKPKDKVYKYSTSKSFGYPSKHKDPKKEKSQSYKLAEDKAYSKPESDETAQEKSDTVNCRTVIKDSMNCQVCLDPHTHENSEQCSYSYDPADKVYAFSKSRSFGTPKKHRE